VSKWSAILTGVAFVGAATALVTCGGCSGSKKDGPPKAGKATAIGTPTPGFAGEAPKGAFKVEDMEIGRYGGRLVLGMPGNPKTFNPMLANDVPSMDIASLLFATCYDYHRLRQEDEPSLCEKYDRSEDGLRSPRTTSSSATASSRTPTSPARSRICSSRAPPPTGSPSSPRSRRSTTASSASS
jgi:hypothetical protein